MLTGRFSRDNKPGEMDFRSGDYSPRWAEGAFEANLALVDEITAIAAAHKVNAAQVALAWVLGRGENILSIPGTTKVANLAVNLGAAEVSLSEDDIARLDPLADKVQGLRYAEAQMASINA